MGCGRALGRIRVPAVRAREAGRRSMRGDVEVDIGDWESDVEGDEVSEDFVPGLSFIEGKGMPSNIRREDRGSNSQMVVVLKKEVKVFVMEHVADERKV